MLNLLRRFSGGAETKGEGLLGPLERRLARDDVSDDVEAASTRAPAHLHELVTGEHSRTVVAAFTQRGEH